MKKAFLKSLCCGWMALALGVGVYGQAAPEPQAGGRTTGSLRAAPNAVEGNHAFVFVVRHAERVSEKADALSELGEQRAACLAATLKDTKIKTILISQFHRTEETAAPTAVVFHVTSKIVKADDFAAIAETARQAASTGDVLIVGHSNTVPQIVKALSGVEITVGPTEYDQLFVIDGGMVRQLHYCPATQPGPESRMK